VSLTLFHQDSRLLGLPDMCTVISVLVLIMNCVHDSKERGYARPSTSAFMKFTSTRYYPPSDRHTLVTTSIGIRVCASILDRLEGLSDASELGDKTKAFELG
jgi:ataxin-10